jgi:hypothetical protein
MQQDVGRNLVASDHSSGVGISTGRGDLLDQERGAPRLRTGRNLLRDTRALHRGHGEKELDVELLE